MVPHEYKYPTLSVPLKCVQFCNRSMFLSLLYKSKGQVNLSCMYPIIIIRTVLVLYYVHGDYFPQKKTPRGQHNVKGEKLACSNNLVPAAC